MIIVSDLHTKRPIISVLMLAYNHEKYIEQSINSVIEQDTDFEYEIIIGEDASTDKTKSICLDYQSKYPDKIKLLLHKKNLGLIGNYKSILSACRGKYIAICACDDYWSDKLKLQKHFDYMEKHENVVVTYHDVRTINEEGNLMSNTFLTETCKRNFRAEELLRGVWIIPLSMCFKNEVSKELVSALNKNVYLEDVFTTSVFGLFGSGAFIDSSASYRFSINSIWSMQRDSLKVLLKTGTYAELAKYYGRKNMLPLKNHFSSLFRSGLANSLDLNFNKYELKLFRTLLWRYRINIVLRDFLYYNKYIISRYLLKLKAKQ